MADGDGTVRPRIKSTRGTGVTEDERFLRSAEGGLEEGPRVRIGAEAWRVFRIMGEFVEGFDELGELGPAVSFFGSARSGPDDFMYQQCEKTARLMGEAGFAIITGGGPGMMEAANKGAKEAGVPSVGLNIELPFEQVANPNLDLHMEFRYFFVRKTMFLKYAQAFMIFPGGFGTLDELFESLTLIQTHKVRDFPLVLFGSDYWGGLVEWLNTMVWAEEKVSAEDLNLIHITDSPEEAVRYVVKHYNDFISSPKV